MKCAECGRENLDDAKFCSYCATPLIKDPEITDTGSALRKIYNDFGYEKVFEDHRYITSALGDFVPDSEMISNSIEMAYRAGLGKVYEAQIRKGGKPNDVFYKRVKELITEDAGLSEKRANQIINCFDEMIGWNEQEYSTTASNQVPEQNTGIFVAGSVVDKDTKNSVEPEKIDSAKNSYTPKTETVSVEEGSEEVIWRGDNWEEWWNSEVHNKGKETSTAIKKTSNSKIATNNPERKVISEKINKFQAKPRVNEKSYDVDSSENASERIIGIIAGIIAAIGTVVLVVLVFIGSISNSSKEATSANTITNSTYSRELLSEAKTGSHVLFGSYEQDNDTSNGKEDIEWIVLDRQDDRILVISKYALDCQKYNNTYNAVTWETSSLRKWLNETFLNTAFSSEERGKISVVTVSADKNPSYSTNPGNATTDKVFLLSITEANNYFGSKSPPLFCKGTDYCFAKGAYKYNKDKCNWWLRSPGDNSTCAAFVNYNGYVYYYGNYVYDDHYAVRPAMWINIGS